MQETSGVSWGVSINMTISRLVHALHGLYSHTFVRSHWLIRMRCNLASCIFLRAMNSKAQSRTHWWGYIDMSFQTEEPLKFLCAHRSCHQKCIVWAEDFPHQSLYRHLVAVNWTPLHSGLESLETQQLQPPVMWTISLSITDLVLLTGGQLLWLKTLSTEQYDSQCGLEYRMFSLTTGINFQHLKYGWVHSLHGRCIVPRFYYPLSLCLRTKADSSVIDITYHGARSTSVCFWPECPTSSN